MRATEFKNYITARPFCDLGNFVTRDSTKQRENATERAEQAVTIQYNAAWVPMIPQPKQFCYYVDTRRTQQHSGC